MKIYTTLLHKCTHTESEGVRETERLHTLVCSFNFHSGYWPECKLCLNVMHTHKSASMHACMHVCMCVYSTILFGEKDRNRNRNKIYTIYPYVCWFFDDFVYVIDVYLLLPFVRLFSLFIHYENFVKSSLAHLAYALDACVHFAFYAGFSVFFVACTVYFAHFHRYSALPMELQFAKAQQFRTLAIFALMFFFQYDFSFSALSFVRVLLSRMREENSIHECSF